MPDIALTEMRRMVRLAVWAGLIALGAWVAVPVGPVPVTLQTFFIFLAGFVEGPVAFWGVLLYLAAGIMGLPVFSGGQAGPALVFGPAAGYALSFPLAAVICGFGRSGFLRGAFGRDGTTQRGQDRSKVARMAVFGVLAMLVNYFFGAVGLILNASFQWSAALWINMTFLPGDLVKIAVAIASAQALTHKGKLFQFQRPKNS